MLYHYPNYSPAVTLDYPFYVLLTSNKCRSDLKTRSMVLLPGHFRFKKLRTLVKENTDVSFTGETLKDKSREKNVSEEPVGVWLGSRPYETFPLTATITTVPTILQSRLVGHAPSTSLSRRLLLGVGPVGHERRPVTQPVSGPTQRNKPGSEPRVPVPSYPKSLLVPDLN